MRPAWGERVLLAAVVAAIAAFLLFEVYDLDIWFHLAIGRTILAGEGIPAFDRWTVAGLGRAYHDSHWLFQVVAAGAHALGGFVGIQALTVLLWGGALAAAWAGTNRAPLPARALLLFVAAMACSERFLPRPEIVTALMIALFVLRLGSGRWSSWRDAALLGALEVVWVNAHGLFVIGPALAACTAVPGLLAWLRWRRPPPVAEARLLGCVTVATFINPHGVAAWKYALLLAGEATGSAGAQIVTQVEELAPTLSRAPMSTPAFWFFALLSAAGVIAVLVGRRRGTVGWDRALHSFLLLALALVGRRNIALAALALPPVIADGLPLAALPTVRFRGVLLPLAATLVAAWGTLAASGAYSERLHWMPARTGLGVTRSYFPHALPEFLRSLGVEGPVYASPSLGGFAEFHGFRPLLDGRWEVQDPRILDAIAGAPSDPASFERLLDFYRLPALILQHEATDARALLPWLARSDKWRLMYWDEAASLWMRADDPRTSGQRNPHVALLSDRQRLFDRVAVDGFLEAIGDHRARIANLRTALEFSGPMQEHLLGWLASAQRESGDLAGAEATTEELVRRYPSNVGGLIDLSAFSLRRGDRIRADAYLVKALAVEPSNQDAQRRLALVRAQPLR